MKIVKLSELNDEERRKLIEEEENRINQRNKERINIQQQANADFNNQIAKSGSYQSKGSTSLGTLRKLYKDNSVTEKSLNNYYNTHKNNNQKTMWDRIKDTAGNSLKQTAIGMTGNPMWSLLGNINNNVNKFVTDEQKNKVGYIGKRTGAGVIQGVTGIGQAGLTDLANQANKGKDKNITNTIGDVVKSFTNISNPASRINPIQTGINTLKTLTDKDKNILQKGISLATGGISDTLNQTIPGKDIINSTTQALGKINPNTSNALLKYTNAISKPSEDINEKLNEEGQKYDTITNMLAGAGQTIGNMAPSIALSTVNPTAGLGLMGLSAKGQSTQEALKKGASLDEAVKIGDTKGMIEIGTEMLSGGINIFGKGALDDLVQKGVVDKVKNKVAKKLVQMGVNNAGEVGEELVSDVLGTLIDKGTVDPNAKYTLNDFKDTAINTILTTTVLNFLTGGLARNVGSINNTKSMNIEQQNQVENQNNINTQQITQTPNNLSQNQTSEQIKATETLKQEIQNSELSNEEKTNMIDYINNNNIDPNSYNNVRQTIDNANNTIENNQEILYNNSNERESDINGYNSNEQRGIENIYQQENTREQGQRGNRVNSSTTESIMGSQNQNDAETHYREFEQQARENQLTTISKESQQVKDIAKNIYNKDIIHYDDNKTLFSGGLSKIDNASVFFGKNAVDNYGDTFLLGHEIGEDMLKNHRDKVESTYNELKEKIQNDDNFGDVFLDYIFDMDEEIKNIYIEHPEAVAKELICDTLGFMQNDNELGNNLPHKDIQDIWINKLNPNLVNEVKQTLKQYHDEIYLNKKNNQELERSSSINLPKKQQKLPTMKDIVSKGEKVDFSEMERPKGKIRKHYKSIIESNNTTKEAKAIAKKMMGTDTYIPESNNNQLERANKRIENSTPDAELQSLMSRSTLGDKITPTDIAVGERLIQYYSLVGDKAKLQDAIQATAMAGTTAGQTVQAMSLLNHQTPEGQAIWIQRSVEKMNEALRKNRGENTEQFNLTPDMLESIVNSKNETELQENVNKVYEELGQQVSKSTMEKIDSWRYFAMLANPRTHIRNIVGNIAMGKTQSVKNKVAGVIEGVASKINSDMERTHTIVPSSAKVKEFAKNDIVNVLDRLGISENKYNPQTRLQNSMKTFKSDMLENTIGKAFGLNDKLLEAEDGWGLKAGYEKALAEYMTANKLTPDNITDAQLGKARNYAVQQAKEATFHQECQLASLVNQLSNKNKFAKYTTDAILPFVKTPMNVAKAGMEYSPVGLAKSMVLDTSRLRKGDINVNQYIDNISKGLTGTGIALVGYALAQCGILKASGDEDDKKEKYDENQGKQTYSIQIGDNTYSLDWLAPTGIPLFIGAEISEMSKAKAEEKTSLSSDSESKYSQTLESGTNLLNAMANSMNPMTEMSMLSGLTSALSSYEQGSAQMLASIGTNSVKSYVNQFVPTALGQIAKTTDEYERSTTSTKSGILPKAIDSTKNQIISKIPGLRQKLPTKTDVWGNDLKQNEGQDTVTQVLDKTISDTGRKFIENAIFPWTRKKISSNNVDKELTDLYDSTGESSVLPSTLDKTLTIDGQKYRMTSNEYANYKKQYGKTAFTIFSNIIKTNDYKNLSEGSRKEVIEDIYSYSKELLKKDYAEKNSLEYTPSTMMKTINSIEYSGGNANTYFKYQGAVSQLKAQKVSSGELEEGQNIKDTDKMQLLVNSNYSNKEKSAIFENCIVNSNENNFYTIALKDSTININEYLQYKIKESNEEFTSDKDKYGNSISGTSKKKYYNYINNNITGYNNKLLLLAQKYKLSNNERQDLTEYINKKYKGQDRIDVFKKLTQNYKVSNDNKIYYK